MTLLPQLGQRFTTNSRALAGAGSVIVPSGSVNSLISVWQRGQGFVITKLFIILMLQRLNNTSYNLLSCNHGLNLKLHCSIIERVSDMCFRRYGNSLLWRQHSAVDVYQSFRSTTENLYDYCLFSSFKLFSDSVPFNSFSTLASSFFSCNFLRILSFKILSSCSFNRFNSSFFFSNASNKSCGSK